jgi:amino acid adenylation domain-containing protein/FkbM family methyltransferase
MIVENSLPTETIESKRKKLAELLQGRLHGPKYRPLSYAQQRLWFIQQLDAGSTAYNLPYGVRLSGALDVAALERSLLEIVRRHEVLRTCFPMKDGDAVQKVLIEADFHLQAVDLSGVEGQEQERIAEKLLRGEMHRPFDLERGPLFRGCIVQLGEQDYVLLVTMHHIVSDGWSLGILEEELGVLYQAYKEGKDSPLPELPIQYADYAVWQREWMQGEVLEQQLSYWRRQVGGAARLDLPVDHPRPNVASYEGAVVPFALPAELTEKLKRICRQENATLFMGLLAGFQWLLGQYSGQSDVVVGSVIANRNRAEVEGLIGFFVNTLVLRTDIGGDPSFRELLARVRDVTLGAYAHQDVPFEKLVLELEPERDLSRTPLFQVMLALQNAPQTQLTLTGATTKNLESERTIARYDMALIVWESEQGLQGTLEYQAELFDKSTIERLLGYYKQILERAVASVETKISDEQLLSNQERQRVLVEWNQTASQFPNCCIHELFEEQVRKTPDAAALVFEQQKLSYAELNRRANQLAHHLQEFGVGPEVRIALCMERSAEMIIGLLAILKAGGAYVPVDPRFPLERIGYLMDDAQAPILLTEDVLSDQLPVGSIHLVRVDVDREMIAEQSEENLSSAVQPQNLAYLIYTSGSTGKPKAVGIEHRQLVNYERAIWERARFKEGSSFALLSSPAADLGNTMLFPALCGGGTLHVISEAMALDSIALAAYIRQHGIGNIKITPSHLGALLGTAEKQEVLPDGILVLGGEASPLDWVNELKSQMPDLRVMNHYGPTESTVGATTCDSAMVTHKPGSGSLPLGRPLANVHVYVLDEKLQPVGMGFIGELFIGGAGVGRGYINRAGLTAGAFIPDPFTANPGARMYRTGDRVRWLADGNLEFLGRIDAQVKIRGYRVELGEIESVLGRAPGVKQCAVVVPESAGKTKRLVAYVVVDRLQKSRLDRTSMYVLPNGMAVAQQNKNETEYLYREIFESEVYLQHGIELPEDACILDAGANIGMFTLFASEKCPRGRIYAFEPIPPIFEDLETNVEQCAAEIKLFPIGIGIQEEEVEFTYYPRYSMMSGRTDYANPQEEIEVIKVTLQNQQQQGQEDAASLLRQADELLEGRFEGQWHKCRIRRLSDVIREAGIEWIDLLKVDVQRSELDALRGIDEEDWQKIGQVVMEVHDWGQGHSTDGRVQQIVSLLEEHGFSVVAEQYDELKGTDRWAIYARSSRMEQRIAPSGFMMPAALMEEKEMSVTPVALRLYLEQRLPDYMMPGAFVLLDQLPLLPNGKLDRRALPAPNEGESSKYVAPRTPVEESLCGIWAEVLERERVGIRDNFFEIGGHSLLGTQVVSRIRVVFQVELPLRALFERPSIESLAIEISQQQKISVAAEDVPLVAVPRDAFRYKQGA